MAFIWAFFHFFRIWPFLKLLMAKFGLFNFFGPGNPASITVINVIRCGAEITISYMSPLTRTGFCGAKGRQKILREEFGFVCSCQACSLANDEEENRDRTRIIQVSFHKGSSINDVTGYHLKRK
jgi:hypothetical protein